MRRPLLLNTEDLIFVGTSGRSLEVNHVVYGRNISTGDDEPRRLI